MGVKIHYNHVGYRPNSQKKFLVSGLSMDPKERELFFSVVNQSGEAVFEGTLSERGYCDYTDETLYEGDFSSLNVPGDYRIVAGSETHLFRISDEIVLEQLKANIKSFYFQRSGVELPKEYAGKWARPAAHFDDHLEFHSMMNREGEWNAHGGWYDAGDYGKYIVNGGVSVGTLLLACEVCGMKMGNEGFVPSFEQPVSLLDEIKFELEFFLRMQDEDGGVFFKVTPGHWDGFMMPVDSDVMQKRYIMGKSTTSSLNFAGALAQAHRVFKAIGGAENQEFATRCLAASRRAYLWAMDNPNVEWPHNTEGSGGYGDEHFEDEFFWARAMLFREADAASYDVDVPANQELARANLRARILRDMELNPPKLGLDWRDTQNMGWIALALDDSDRELHDRATAAILSTADEIIRLQKEDCYSISIRKFIWGSNGDVANHALTLCIAYELTHRLEYRQAAEEQIQFIYGRNPVDVSFVTGSAWSSPMNSHHRICHADGVIEPIPGLLAGGINNDRQDMIRKPHYPGTLPGFAYTDERCSFASNETAINWNSPLTTVLALLSRP